MTQPHIFPFPQPPQSNKSPAGTTDAAPHFPISSTTTTEQPNPQQAQQTQPQIFQFPQPPQSSQVSFIAWKIRKIGEASADTAATETYYMKGYYNLEEETIKVKIWAAKSSSTSETSVYKLVINADFKTEQQIPSRHNRRSPTFSHFLNHHNRANKSPADATDASTIS